MGRPVGRHVIETCEMLEKIGPSKSSAIAKARGIKPENTGNYCARAVDYGFVLVDKDSIPFIFDVKPNWRELLEKYNAVRVNQIKVEPESVAYAMPANSVFDTARFLQG